MSKVTAYMADSDSAGTTFGLRNQSLYNNYPRLPFEYYIDINLDNTDYAKEYYTANFNCQNKFEQIHPLVKMVDMPSMKIETANLNQYNRKRIVQNKMQFDPIKMVFHDVADGKTLAFWQMYYTYYFRDGLEGGTNSPVYDPTTIIQRTDSTGNTYETPASSPNDTSGQKHCIDDVITPNMTNHNFGYNLLGYEGMWPTNWKKPKNLIKTIVIYQLHAGRFNKVTLVNPRITSFTHDTLNYAGTDKTLELTFMFEYEYAYYNIENESLDADQQKTLAASFMEIAHPNFNVTVSPSFLNSPTNKGKGKNNTGNALQRALNSKLGQAVVGSLGLDTISGNRITTSTSSLAGILNIRPLPISNILHPQPLIQSFKHTTVDNLKTLGATTVKGTLQSTISSGEDSVVNGISSIATTKYVPTDLSSPYKGSN